MDTPLIILEVALFGLAPDIRKEVEIYKAKELEREKLGIPDSFIEQQKKQLGIK